MEYITSICSIIKVRIEYIDVYYHNSCDLLACKIVEYGYVNMYGNSADLLTKGLQRRKHKRFMRTIVIWYLVG